LTVVANWDVEYRRRPGAETGRWAAARMKASNRTRMTAKQTVILSMRGSRTGKKMTKTYMQRNVSLGI
jgi:hypothetical protein